MAEESEGAPAKKAKPEPGPARIAVIGAAWWSQGWHLPQLERNPDAEIAAIVQRSEQPTAAAFLNLTLETKTQLRARYPGVPMFDSCEAMLADAATMARTDGVIVCTAHACHASMGAQFLAAGKHVLMEKPMTVDVAEARALAAQATAAARRRASAAAFMVNNTANFREQCFEARRRVAAGEPASSTTRCASCTRCCSSCSTTRRTRAGRRRARCASRTARATASASGRHARVVLHVGALEPEAVTAVTHRSARSGADLTDAALVRCARGCSICLSAGCAWPGNEHGDEATGKHFDIKLFGAKGVLSYAGDDKDPASGRLELRYHDGRPSYVAPGGFRMENTEPQGVGPESLLEFVKACRGLPYRNGADQHVGLQAVRVLDAMYRSAASGKTEPCL